MRSPENPDSFSDGNCLNLFPTEWLFMLNLMVEFWVDFFHMFLVWMVYCLGWMNLTGSSFKTSFRLTCKSLADVLEKKKKSLVHLLFELGYACKHFTQCYVFMIKQHVHANQWRNFFHLSFMHDVLAISFARDRPVFMPIVRLRKAIEFNSICWGFFFFFSLSTGNEGSSKKWKYTKRATSTHWILQLGLIKSI